MLHQLWRIITAFWKSDKVDLLKVCEFLKEGNSKHINPFGIQLGCRMKHTANLRPPWVGWYNSQAEVEGKGGSGAWGITMPPSHSGVVTRGKAAVGTFAIYHHNKAQDRQFWHLVQNLQAAIEQRMRQQRAWTRWGQGAERKTTWSDLWGQRQAALNSWYRHDVLPVQPICTAGARQRQQYTLSVGTLYRLWDLTLLIHTLLPWSIGQACSLYDEC